jgi:integrase/recombinase XerD
MDRSLIQIQPAITDLVRQARGKESKRIYERDALAFADWITEQGFTLSGMTYSLFLAYKDYLETAHQKATAARMLSIARRLLDEAVHHGILKVNPGKEVKGITVSNESPHVALKLSEAKTFLSGVSITTKQGKRDYALLSLLLRTGIRRTECASLTIGDVHMEQGHHVMTIAHGKGDKRRTAKIPVDVFRSLTEYLEATKRMNDPLDAPLFCGFYKGDVSNNKGLSDKRIEQIVIKYGTLALKRHVTPHDLRASFITLAIEGDATLLQVQYAAGHSDPRTTERYHTRKLNLDDNAVDYIKL